MSLWRKNRCMKEYWKPRNPEIKIEFNPLQLRLYSEKSPECIYKQWPISVGRSRHGEFPLVVARQYFVELGYTVWASEPELPDDDGYILVSFPGKRRGRHPAYLRMTAFFDLETLSRLNGDADCEKKAHTGNASGGDPDLFVFRGSEYFFVEVKWRDKITKKQSVTFPIIEKYCKTSIVMARIHGQLQSAVV